MAKINHLNFKDGFMKAYLDKRRLRGMPFLMGKECRTEVKAALFSEVARAFSASYSLRISGALKENDR